MDVCCALGIFAARRSAEPKYRTRILQGGFAFGLIPTLLSFPGSADSDLLWVALVPIASSLLQIDSDGKGLGNVKTQLRSTSEEHPSQLQFAPQMTSRRADARGRPYVRRA